MRIASTIASAESLGGEKRKYESTSQSLRESRSRAQSSLNQSIQNQKKAEEQINSITAKLEREIRAIQEQNEAQIIENQARIDQE
eukprot:13524818-Ditylum_brightwellii.AAC.1